MLLILHQHHAEKMIIYKDIFTGDEMFSDIYKIIETDNGVLIEVEGKQISRTENLDDSLFGCNASAEEQVDSIEPNSTSGIDIIMNHKLVETFYKKDSFKVYIKEYMKEIKAKLEEERPERVEDFIKNASKAVAKILANLSDYQFFMGESMDPKGSLGFLNFREDGLTPFMIFFKDGLEIEKC